MARIPRAARVERPDNSDDDDSPRQQRKHISLSDHILTTVEPPHLGRPPKDDEEKRRVFQALVALKAARKTNRECAEVLDVTERTISNWLADALYKEVADDLQAEARQRGHISIALMVDDALAKLYELMHGAKSEFVAYKAGETLLNFAGYNMPREEARRDNQQEYLAFMEKMAQVKGQQTQVNVTITTEKTATLPAPSVEIVEATVEEEPPAVAVRSIPAGLEKYYETVQPGGRLPGAPPPSTGR